VRRPAHVRALTGDRDRDPAVRAARGVGVPQGGQTAAGVAFADLDTDPDDAGGVREPVRPTAGIARFFARIAAAADARDGTNPRIDP
jgi:hypothetical protein